MAESTESNRIVILGGGFGGLYTALRLAELPWDQSVKPEIVLVDRSDRFVFLPLLYELMTGELQTWEVAPPYSEVLANTPVRFVQDSVAAIYPGAKSVTLASGEVLSYSRLVLGLGGETPLDIVPGAAEHAIPFRSLEDAYRLEDRLKALEQSDSDKIRVAVVGGGYSGVELACKLADRLGDRGRLRIVEQSDKVLRNSPEFNRTAADAALEKRGIWVDWETTVDEITADTISLTYRGETDSLPVDATLWTVGNRIPELVRSLPLEKNDRGQIKADATLCTSDPAIFAVGDLAESCDRDGAVVPSTGQVAIQQADYAAWNVWASLGDRPALEFRYQNLGEMLALGNTEATLSGLGLTLDGPLAYAARRLVYLYRMPSFEHQVKVGLNWLTQPLLKGLGLGA
ncbi:MAG: NAD(P)/FAD-dependent oxidoreductase [Cyanobacteria bacterium P01_D01_bin.73]